MKDDKSTVYGHCRFTSSHGEYYYEHSLCKAVIYLMTLVASYRPTSISLKFKLKASKFFTTTSMIKKMLTPIITMAMAHTMMLQILKCMLGGGRE